MSDCIRGRHSRRGRSGNRGRRGFRGRGRGVVSLGHSRNIDDIEVLSPCRDDGKQLVDIDTKARDLFSGTVSFADHYDSQMENPELYAATVAVLLKSGYGIPQNAKVRSLAAAWARNDKALSRNLLALKQHFGVSTVLKAFIMLDAGRQARAIEKKIAMVKSCGNVSNKRSMIKKIGDFKFQMNNLMEMKTKNGSATKRVCKEIQTWVGTLSPQELEFYAVHFPTEPWKKLSDLCHLHPEKDFSLAWFLPFCYGQLPPEKSLVHQCKDLNIENVNEILSSCPVPYSLLKDMTKSLTDKSKGILAKNEPKMETILWYYEDLQCKEVDDALKKRLVEGYEVKMATGKLLERLLVLRMIREGMNLENLDDLYFKWDWDRYPDGPPGIRECVPNYTKATFYSELLSQTEKQMNLISLPLDNPVFIMGDASASMDVAIRTSAIITGILAAVTCAKLSFFNDREIKPEVCPSSAEDAINLAITMQASSSTCPAACLYPLYEEKEVVKTIIVVTDEEENSKFVVEKDGFSTSYKFLDVYKLYHAEVYPAQLVFVSFLEQTQTGQMVKELGAEGFSFVQYKLDKIKPDLSKLDRLFAQLATKTATFLEELEEERKKIISCGIDHVFEPLRVAGY